MNQCKITEFNVKILFQISTRTWYVIRTWGEYQWDLLPLQIQPLSIQDPCQNLQTKDTLLRSYFWLFVCKYPYFSQKLRKHYLVQNADVGKQNPPTLMASEIALSGNQTSWTQWIYFQATQKSPAHVSTTVHISMYDEDSGGVTQN